ncbi:flagellar basal body P-ring formation chaperone FlgA [Alloyangia pacifica]|uniref:flagellar basal body P-ring formation chaperone FlgA n=1 Tax=Alloyangia pacifica TaxID=311180 RepID=UPI001CD1B983|nr:flagellar basal body P-ring formation chaperone FlgA [Alloyangia pacifica]MCA0995416.1 flagellar basal body P-ring formation chaperone FlgA [Alloyangia pacifica]
MRRALHLILSLTLALPCVIGLAHAESVLAARPIRAQEIIGADALRLDPKSIDGAVTTLEDAIGRESRTAIYAGQPLMRAQLAEPALIERNQLVELIYTHGGLRISAEGRAMARGRVGDRIRVMNISSRNMLVGTVGPGGKIDVSPE